MSVDLVASIAWTLTVFCGVFLLPGAVFLRPVRARLYLHELPVYTVGFSVIFVGVVFHTICLGAGPLLGKAPVAGIQLLLLAVLIAVAIHFALRRSAPMAAIGPAQNPLSRRQGAVYVGCALLTAVVYSFLFAESNHRECLYSGTFENLVGVQRVPPFFASLYPQEYADMVGTIAGKPMALFMTNGQKEGSIFALLPFIPAFRLFGFALAYLLLHVGLFSAAFSLAYRLFHHFAAGIVAGAFAAFHPILLSRSRLDENVIALLALLMLFTWLSIRPISRVGLGLLAAWTVATMHEFALPLGAFAACHWVIHRWQPRRLLRVVATAAIAGLPVLIRHMTTLGSPFRHESTAQFGAIPHAIGPWHFNWHGLLNWPFFPELVRPIYSAAPTVVLLPAFFLRESGLLLTAATVTGVFLFLHRQWRVALPYLAFTLVVFGYLGVQSNWTETKKLGVLLHAFVLPILGVAFVPVVLKERRGFWPLVAGATTTLALSLLLLTGARRTEFKPEPRAELYLPEFHAFGDKYLTILKNWNEWMVMGNTPETADIRAFERHWLYDVSWLPPCPSPLGPVRWRERADAARTVLKLFLHPDFCGYQDDYSARILDALGSQVFPMDGFSVLRDGSGCPAPPAVAPAAPATSADRVRLTIPLSPSWFSTPPTLAATAPAAPCRADIDVQPGDLWAVASSVASPNGYHRLLFVDASQTGRLNLVGFYLKDTTALMARLATRGAKALVREGDLHLCAAYPILLNFQQTYRMVPGKSYNWAGFVDEVGRFEWTGPAQTVDDGHF